MEEPEMTIILGVQAFFTRLCDVVSDRITTIQVLKRPQKKLDEWVGSTEIHFRDEKMMYGAHTRQGRRCP
jgi:hypothetical protein